MAVDRINWSYFGELRESEGELKYANMLIRLINEGKVNTGNFSLKGLHKSLGEPRLFREDKGLDEFLVESDLREQMDSSAFPKITGALINKMVQEGYDLAAGVGDMLVTEIEASQKDDTIVGFGAMDELKEIIEGAEYQAIEFGEKYHKIKNTKYGARIDLTEEMVRFDQTGQFIARAQNIGRMAAYKKEEIIMNAICEKTSTGELASWRPGGTSTALYSDTSTDPYSPQTYDNVNTNKLADESDIDEQIIMFAAAKNEKGSLVQVVPNTILVAPGYLGIAKKIVNSTGSTLSNKSQAVINPYQGDFQVVASQWVQKLLSSVYWLMGDFKRQFVYTRVFPLQTSQAKPGNDAEFERDVIYSWKTRLMGGCGAVSNLFVIRSTGAS